MVAWAFDADLLEDRATEPDERDGERVDRDLEGEDDRVLRVGPDDRRRPARRAQRSCSLLRDEVGGHELADEAADRAAGEARAGDELGSGQRSASVKLADDRAEVGAADGLAALPDLDDHRVCVPLFQIYVEECYMPSRHVNTAARTLARDRPSTAFTAPEGRCDDNGVVIPVPWLAV